MVTTPLLEKKLLKTENLTTSDDVQNVLRRLQQARRVLKVLTRFTNVLRILKQTGRLTKVLKKWNIWKRQWSQSVGSIQIRLRVSLMNLLIKGRTQSCGQNRLLIIDDGKWFETSYVASQFFCTSVGTILLYGKTCVRRTLRGEVLAHLRSRCGVTLRWIYLGEFGICRYVGCILLCMVGEWCL